MWGGKGDTDKHSYLDCFGAQQMALKPQETLQSFQHNLKSKREG